MRALALKSLHSQGVFELVSSKLSSRSVIRRFCQDVIRPVELAHHTYDGVDPPIIFLHGLFGSKSNWQSIAKKINQKTHRKAIIVDARNHGESLHSDVMSYPSMSADLIALLDKLQIEKAVLLGHSMGGKVAMVTALTKPELVDRLIVVDIAPVSSGKSTIDFPSYIRAMRNIKFDNSITRSAMRRLADRQIQDVVPDVRDRQFLLTNLEERSGHYMWRVNLDATEKQLKSLYSFDHFNTVYDGPTFFIGGGNSPYICEKHYPQISRLFPRSAVTHIEGAGHWVHSEKPSDFITLVLKFLNGNLIPDYFNQIQVMTDSKKLQSPYVIGS